MNPDYPEELGSVRPGEDLNWTKVEQYLRANVEGLGALVEVLQFPNGSANLTYFLRFADRPLVMRRPPFGHIAVGAHDMKREFKVLSRLWQSYDRAPRAYLLCTDSEIVGSDFFVSEYRQGQVIWGVAPPSMKHHEQLGKRVGLAVVDALAELHNLDPRSAELDDLGRPEGFVDRQLSGWHDRWRAVSEYANTNLMDEVAVLLIEKKPVTEKTSILHNDYKIDNCQFDPQNPDRVLSIFDWDMATLGDPLIDVGILLNYWPDPQDGEVDRPVFPVGLDTFGLPTRAEAVDRYVERTGADVRNLHWYEAFAAWKTGIVLQQLYARFLRGETSDARQGDKGGDRVTSQASRAMRILESAS
ncbi:MAG: phosphotransferase family protein [Acidimicrobiales bacterium]